MKKLLKKVLAGGAAVLVGAALGVVLGIALAVLTPEGAQDTGWPAGLDIAVMLLAAGVSYLLQVVVHEGGHLVCGLLSGYKFLSFRVGSVMLVRQGDKLVWRRFSLPGTAGQCLMMPLEEDAPQQLYNLGGGIANLVVSALAMLLLLVSSHFAVSVFLVFTILWGLVSAATNLIPLRVGGIANDGYNARALKRDPQARKAFLDQLRINGRMAQGVTLRDMPAEWFQTPEDANWADPLVCSTAYLAIARLQDQGDIPAMQAAIGDLLDRDTGLLGLHRSELECDRLFCELVLDDRPEERERLYTPQVKKHIKATRAYMPHKYRILYAWALLAEGDREKAAQYRAAFEKGAARYPYPVEMDSERRLLELVDEKAGSAK